MFARLALILALITSLAACGFLGGGDDGKPAPLETEEFGDAHVFTVGLPTNALFKRAHKVEVGKKEPQHKAIDNGLRVYYGDPDGSDAAGSGFTLFLEALPADRDIPAVLLSAPGIPAPEAVSGGAFGRGYHSEIGFDTVDFAARYGDHIYRACVLFAHGIFESDMEAFTILGSQDKELGDFLRRFVAFYREKYETIPAPAPAKFGD